jgi:hypothetical protein
MSREILVNTLDQSYIATCYPLPNREGLDQCIDWKTKLKHSVLAASSINLSADDLRAPFPHLYRLLQEGYFDSTTIQDYFEGTNSGSHNQNLYLFAKAVYRRLKRAPEPVIEEILFPVLNHINGCAVKPANLDDHTIWSFGKIITTTDINQNYFGNHPAQRFALVHGIENGQHIIIRSISEDEFSAYSSWYTSHFKSNGNPFSELNFP